MRNDTRITAPPTLNACAGGNRWQRPCVAISRENRPVDGAPPCPTRRNAGRLERPGSTGTHLGAARVYRLMTTAFRVASAPPYAPHGPFTTPQRLTFDRDRPTTRAMSTQQLSTSTSPRRTRARPRSFGRPRGRWSRPRDELSTSELAPVNPALTAAEGGYQQWNAGGAVVVVDDASAQVLAGSGARPPHVDDLAVMGEEPVALAALKEGAPRTSWSCSPSPRSDKPATSFPGRSGSSSASRQRRGQGRETGAA